ncbi:fimbrial protein, partial [Escherichia coli]|nr:fimbrial protein [Escherichia coli]
YPGRAGKSMPPLIVGVNEEGLEYSRRIVRNGYPVKAGDYSAAVGLKLDYE